MSQGFKLKYDDLHGSRTDRPSAEEGASDKAFEDYYSDDGQARNLSLVWPDGRRVFFSYSFLVSVEYAPEESTLKLVFTAQTFVLKGVNLQGLYYDLMRQSIRQITAIDERYNLVGDGEKFVVNEIAVLPAQ